MCISIPCCVYCGSYAYLILPIWYDTIYSIGDSLRVANADESMYSFAYFPHTLSKENMKERVFFMSEIRPIKMNELFIDHEDSLRDVISSNRMIDTHCYQLAYQPYCDGVLVQGSGGFLTLEQHMELREMLNHLLSSPEMIKELNEYHLQKKKEQEIKEAVFTEKSTPKVDITKRKKHGYVYFVQCNNQVKIGLSKQWTERVKAYGVLSPFVATVLHVIETDDCVCLEKHFHNKFANKRVEGEWFSLSEQDIKQICSGKYETDILCKRVALKEVI